MSASRPATSGSSGSAGVHAAGEADGLAGEVGAGEVGAAAGGVALVEEQVEDVEHRAQALGALVGRRERERLVRRLDLGLGPADPLGHGRLGDEERGGDLAGREPADRPQRERDRRRRRERRVAAHEHQDQRVVLARTPGRRRCDRPATPARSSRRRRASSRRYWSAMRRDATRIEPAERVVGHALGGPRGRGGDAAPPAPRPRRRRSRRSGGRPHRGPAARARAAGPRCSAAARHTSGSGALMHLAHLDGLADRRAVRAGRGRRLGRDLDRPVDACRRRSCGSRRAAPSTRGTGRR